MCGAVSTCSERRLQTGTTLRWQCEKSRAHFCDTGRANILAFEMDDFIRLAAKDTSWLVLLEDDAVAIDVNLQRVFLTDA